MKKIIALLILFIIIILPLLLCGCERLSDYSEPEQQYTVSAIGFDNSAGDIKVSVEAIIIKSESSQSSIETRLFSDTGETVEQALTKLTSGLAKGLLLSHCGTVILGDTLNKIELNEIFEYCFAEEAITLAANIISTADSEELLRCESISTPVVGYDIMGVLKEKSKDIGIGRYSTFYKIQAKRSGIQNVFSVPYFTVDKTGDESTYFLSGLKIFENDTAVLTLNQTESILYSIICNEYRGGQLCINTDSGVKQAAVYRSQTSLKCLKEGESLNFTVETDMSLSGNQTLNSKPDELGTALSAEIREFIIKTKNTCGTDVFGLQNIITLKNKKLSEEISNNYLDLYKNSNISVTTDITEKGWS